MATVAHAPTSAMSHSTLAAYEVSADIICYHFHMYRNSRFRYRQLWHGMKRYHSKVVCDTI